ncbi:hypothetical protein H2509_11315 [Stappia sp. F7233]|uniref:Uncharacterized protein n=1 Tax=Stappia albiluteola TaxID=2758565 RepID=A0A839ADF7_9HYPH|nr:hypothetical protein [Stappia albiluteola]MBA5777713.1 hypothetical protein [Stappia albiluteola]
MLSGRETLGSIEKALGELKREEAAINARLERSTARLAELGEASLEAYRELARFRLTEEQGAALAGRLDEADREAKRYLDARAARLDGLAQDRAEHEAAAQQLMSERTRMVAERETAADRLDDVMERVDDRLAADSDYIARKKAADIVRSRAEAARAKANQSEEDRDQKGMAYESDPLFLYLWNRGFGTPAYRSGGLIRMLDRWVAGLIRFHDARPNYAMLTEIPVRLDAHATDLERQAEAEMQALAELSRKAASEIAGEDLAGRIANLDAAIMEITAKLEATERALSGLSADEQTLLQGEDEDFREAQASLARTLSAEDLQSLWSDALATPSREDEKIVDRIREIEQELEQARGDIEHDRSLLRDIARRRDELAEVAREFRRSGYDDWNSTFTDDSLTTVLLGELVKGVITAADYWARAERSHRSRSPRGRGIGFPDGFGLPGSMGGSRGRSGGFPGGWGGGSSRGGFKTGSRMGGGGFKTGRTF